MSYQVLKNIMYDPWIHVCYGGKADYEKAWKKYANDKPEFNGQAGDVSYQANNKGNMAGIFWIYINKTASMYTVMHEMVHLVDRIFQWVDMDEGSTYTEPRAYYYEYLMKRVLKILPKRMRECK